MSDDLKTTFGPAVQHLGSSLQGYDSVGFIGFQDISEIRNFSLATKPEPANSMLNRLVERMFPEQSAQILANDENRQAMELLLNQMIAANRNGYGAATNGRLKVGDQVISVGFIFMDDEKNKTPQDMIRYNLPGTPDEDRDKTLRKRQFHDSLILSLTHEIGHLVDLHKDGIYMFDPRREPQQLKLSQTEENTAEREADKFAISQLSGLSAAGIISNGQIGVEFMQARVIEGINEILKVRQGADIGIDHLTGVLDDPQRLQNAAIQINALWHEHQKGKDPNPEDVYSFMQGLKNRNDIPADVQHMANTYVRAYDYMIAGRSDVARPAKELPGISTDKSEPRIVNGDTKSSLMIGSESLIHHFADLAQGRESVVENELSLGREITRSKPIYSQPSSA